MTNILVLRNTAKKYSGHIARAVQLLESLTGQKFFVDVKDTNYYTGKDVYVQNPNGSYGLKNGYFFAATETPRNTFHISVFLYDFPNDLPRTAGWVHINPLSDKTIVCEIPVRDDWGDQWVEKAFAHEICHALIRRAWALGVSPAMLFDDLDGPEYQKDLNRYLRKNLERLGPYWGKIGQKTTQFALWIATIQSLLVKVGILRKQVENVPEVPLSVPEVPPVIPPPTPTKRKIEEMAEAIQEFEGWYPGSMSFRNSNPGNIRGVDGKFLVFPTDQTGFAYLLDYLVRAATGKHAAYKPTTTIQQFFETYAPVEDLNDPLKYASFVSKKVGVPIDTRIKDLL